jgi:hypothetical protein
MSVCDTGAVNFDYLAKKLLACIPHYKLIISLFLANMYCGKDTQVMQINTPFLKCTLVHVCDPSSWEAKAGGSLSSRPGGATK